MGCSGCDKQVEINGQKWTMHDVAQSNCHYIAQVRGITLYIPPGWSASGPLLTPDGYLHGDILMVRQSDGLWTTSNIVANLSINGSTSLELSLAFENKMDSALRFWACGEGFGIDLFLQRMRIRKLCGGAIEFTMNHASGIARGAGGSIRISPFKP